MTKPRYGLTSRIAPGIDLRQIIVTLDPYGPPRIEMQGTIQTGKRAVDAHSSVLVTTAFVGPQTVRFLEELKAAFSNVAAKEKPHD